MTEFKPNTFTREFTSDPKRVPADWKNMREVVTNRSEQDWVRDAVNSRSLPSVKFPGRSGLLFVDPALTLAYVAEMRLKRAPVQTRLPLRAARDEVAAEQLRLLARILEEITLLRRCWDKGGDNGF